MSSTFFARGSLSDSGAGRPGRGVGARNTVQRWRWFPHLIGLREKKMKTRGIGWLAICGMLMAICGAGAAAAAWAAQEGTTGGAPVSMVVSVEAKHGKDVPTVAIEDVNVFQ